MRKLGVVFSMLVLVALAAWLVYGKFTTSHRHPALPVASVDSVSSRNPDSGHKPKPIATTRPEKPPILQAAAKPQDRSSLDPIVAFSTATNQQEAMEAIRRLEQTNLSSALDARTLMAHCRLNFRVPDYFSGFADGWHKSRLIEYCQGYNDPTEVDQMWKRARNGGTKARTYKKLRAIEEAQGIEAALAQLQEMLKTEQDPFAMQALFEYLAAMNGHDKVQMNEAVRGFPLAANLPGRSEALTISSQLAYCEMSGGCGPYHLDTLGVCVLSGLRCSPGASYRNFYDFNMPPAMMQDVDIILARWRSLRRCGQYRCRP